MAVLIFGGFGVWAPIILNSLGLSSWLTNPLVNALYTYFPAIAGASAIDLLFGTQIKLVKSFAILVLAVIIIWATTTLGYKNIYFGIIGVLLSLSLWWVANGDNPNLLDFPSPDATLGGDTSNPVNGQTDDFKT